MTERHGNGVHDGLAKAAKNEQKNGDAFNEDDGHGGLPTEPHRAAKRVGDDGVDAHTGSAGQRTIRDEAHRDRHDAGANAGGSDRGGHGNAACRQDKRVDDDDVSHRQERCQAGAKLGRDVRVALPQLEELVHVVIPLCSRTD